MSDSDDTDILLLIPPDFFVIESSDAGSPSFEDHNVERSVVNDLISHVNELENRISEIEKKDPSVANLNDSISSINSSQSPNFLNREMNSATRHLGSDTNINISPSKRVTRFNSLPPTPSSSSYRSYVPSVSSSRTWAPNHSSPSRAMSKSSKNLSGSNWDSSNDNKLKGNNLLSEVDLFLDGLKRDSASSRGTRERDLIAGVLPPSPQKKDSADGVARLQLDEVDRLLKEVEAEQKNIEARLSSHDAPEVRRIVKKPGETIGSIPDLGYGVRDQWKDIDNFLQKERYQNPDRHFLQRQRDREPVEEPIVTSRNQYKLGDNVGSIPDRGFGVRDAWASTPGRENKPVLQSEPYSKTVEDTIVPETASVLRSDGTSPTKLIPKVFASRRKLDLEPHARVRGPRDDMAERDTATSLDSFPPSADQVGGARNRRDVGMSLLSFLHFS